MLASAQSEIMNYDGVIIVETSLATQSTVDDAPTLSRPMNILVIDDNELDRQRLIRLCGQAGLNIHTTQVEGLAQLEEALARFQYDVIFIDYYLAGDTGLEALEMIAESDVNKQSASIMLAGEGQINVAVEAMRKGCSDYMTKAMMNVDTLQKSIATALERQMMAATLAAEKEARQNMENAIVAYSKSCTVEMRSVLAGTLRRVRKLRKYQAERNAEYSVDVTNLETDIDKLWEALPDFRSLPEVEAPDPTLRIEDQTRH